MGPGKGKSDGSGLKKEEDKNKKRIEKLNEDPDEPSEQDLMAKEAYKFHIDKEGDKIYELPYDFKNLDELMEIAKKDEKLLDFLRDTSSREGVSGKNGEAWAGADIIDYLRTITSADKYEMPKKEGSKYIDLREVFDTAKKAEARIKAIEKGKEYIVVHYTKYTNVEGNERKQWFEIEAKPIEVKEMDTKSTIEDTNKAHEIVKVPENIYKLEKEADKLPKVEDMTNKKMPNTVDDTAKALKKPKDETAETIEQIGIKANIIKIEAKDIDVKKDLITLGMKPEDFDTHESDLYVKKTPISEKYLETYDFKDAVTTFKSNKEPKDEIWYDFPFASNEWWNKRSENKSIKKEEKINEDIKSAEKIVAKQNEITTMTQDIENLLMAFYDHDESASGKIAKNNIKNKIGELNKKIEALKIEIKADGNTTEMLTTAPKIESPKEENANVPSLSPEKEDKKVDPTAVNKDNNNISDTGLALGQGFILHKDNEKNELYVLDKEGTEVVRVPNLIKDDSASKIEFFTKLLNLTPSENKEDVKEENKDNESNRLDKIEKKVDELLNIEKGEKEQMTAEEKVSQKQNEELAILKKDIETKKPQIAKIIQSLIDNNKISITREDMRAYITKGEDPIFAKKKVKEDKLKSLNKKLWAMDNDTLKVLYSVFCEGKKEIKSSKENNNNMSDFLMFLNS
jgi:hypothetical protein